VGLCFRAFMMRLSTYSVSAKNAETIPREMFRDGPGAGRASVRCLLPYPGAKRPSWGNVGARDYRVVVKKLPGIPGRVSRSGFNLANPGYCCVRYHLHNLASSSAARFGLHDEIMSTTLNGVMDLVGVNAKSGQCCYCRG
jgi:hypothetical protein